ncbi:U4/U6.U5 tri-snRNP-associated protein 2 [Trichinella britovi]|uniref:Ubiquitin carboxyl-terminal hydrolase 39 n=2 Tax=Trichinella TaxID=6333 RepID=A0A0V1CRU7_TRIBR|nr:U4/U6.U5 tri-snRNP-associated protein 2 [Trichinella murrelli]KRX65738.1 U4/U6.U5 tri-snRNP-associated protein 2 [Trichinella sp. T9]KRX81165.1 U4/U6.U5 tri-snRNP-associated protein 2 [Trichinella sp. T6]KRY52010.1 U4/U6.U5 tri-snRNP-associated protein 2 [Trichinella britovi]
MSDTYHHKNSPEEEEEENGPVKKKFKVEVSAEKLNVSKNPDHVNEVDNHVDEEESTLTLPSEPQLNLSRSCPYLDSINRQVLDFDFEKLCSVSLSHLNVYACLVCGKYFQGRGNNTHAYTHSVDIGHRVFLNLQTLRFYCLPDNYEIIDSSLDDIKYVLKPTYSPEHISTLSSNTKLSRAFDGTTYYPGMVGLNIIKANDYMNVILQALAHVPPLRDYFLCEDNYKNVKRPPGDKMVLLYQRFGELIRKMWNPRNFKAHVSPHEMLQAVVLCSNKRFQITEQGDAIDVLSWLLNALHVSLNGTNRTDSSIIYRTFRGKMRTFKRQVLPVDANEEERTRLLLTEEYQERVQNLPFLFLTLDLPPAPLYRDEFFQNIIPQVPLAALLAKFNGITEKEYKTYNENIMKRFEITHLPPYLIMFVKRFTKNHFYVEKNPTIVNFPIRNVDLYDYLSEDGKKRHPYTTYDMIANIVHDGKPDPGEGSYRIQLVHKGTGKWFELEDLHVKEILPQMITLTESYIQVWEMNFEKTRDQRSGEETMEE